MRIGVKPGQVGLSVEELQALWREAEDAGFESVWTYDQLVGTPCYEALSLLAAMAVVTHRVRLRRSSRRWSLVIRSTARKIIRHQ